MLMMDPAEFLTNEEFMRRLAVNYCNLHGRDGGDLRVPHLGGEVLNLQQLYIEVMRRGGVKKVCELHKWNEVAATFNFKKTVTNMTYCVKMYYFKFLLSYEAEHNPVFQTPYEASIPDSMKKILPPQIFSPHLMVLAKPEDPALWKKPAPKKPKISSGKPDSDDDEYTTLSSLLTESSPVNSPQSIPAASERFVTGTWNPETRQRTMVGSFKRKGDSLENDSESEDDSDSKRVKYGVMSLRARCLLGEN